MDKRLTLFIETLWVETPRISACPAPAAEIPAYERLQAVNRHKAKCCWYPSSRRFVVSGDISDHRCRGQKYRKDRQHLTDPAAIGWPIVADAILGRQDGHSGGPSQHDHARTSKALREAGSASPCPAEATLSLPREPWAYMK